MPILPRPILPRPILQMDSCHAHSPGSRVRTFVRRMNEVLIVQLSAFPGWLAGVSSTRGGDYCCWVVTPELLVLDDGEVYHDSEAAMASARGLVEASLAPISGEPWMEA